MNQSKTLVRANPARESQLRLVLFILVAMTILAPLSPLVASSFEAAAAPSTFAVVQDGAKARVTWHASSLTAVGYNLWREEDGVRTQVNKHLIASSALLGDASARVRSSYRIEDTLSSPTSFVQYWLEAVDAQGEHTWEGPMARTFGKLSVEPAERSIRVSLDAAATPSALQTGLGSSSPILVPAAGFGAVRPTTLPAPTSRQQSMQATLAADAGLKIFVTTEGWYRISRAQMAAAGYDPGSDPTKLELYCQGLAQPIVVNTGTSGTFASTDTIEFYGLGLDTPATGARTYWLRTGTKGVRYTVPTTKASASSASVAFTFERKDRTYFAPLLAGNDDAENFFAPMITSASISQDLTVTNPDPAFQGNATLQLVLQGLRSGAQSSVGVELNGHTVGNLSFINSSPMTQKTYSIPVPQTWLATGANPLKLTSLNGPSDVSLLVSASLTYQHLLRADDGLLEVTLPASTPVSVTGFPTAAIRAIDVTDPASPSALGVAIAADGAAFTATFATPRSKTASTILVFSDNRVLGAPEMVVNAPSSWSTSSRTLRADLVIVTNGAFAAEAATLKSVRDAGGIATVIADVEDIYDEYSYGVRTPQAIRTFLEDTSNWKTAPRYVLLFGDASFDPRNYLGLGANDFVPTKLMEMMYLKTASDDWFTDFDNDGVADLPIGRLPVRTALEAATVIDKITSRGVPSGTWASSALLISDVPVTYDFPTASANLVPLLPTTIASTSIAIAQTATPRDAITSAINSGQLLVNYFGHGSVGAWSSNVFNSDDATALTNGNQAPLMMLIACTNGYFASPYARSLAESLVQAPNGGAVAVWASSSITNATWEELLNKELYRQLFAATQPTIGEAMVTAKLSISDPDVRRSYILFGDPSMKLR